MTIHPNGVAVITGDSHHNPWCREQGLVHDRWFAGKLTQIIETIIQREGKCVVLEGGANIGTLTYPMLEAGARVIAFEPNPEARKCLLHNCSPFNLLDAPHARNSFCLPFALGESRGKAMLRLQANAGASYCENVTPERVRDDFIDVAPMDDWFGPVHLIKLDIEGFELKALRGARRIINELHPVLVLEVNRGALERAGDSPEALFEFIESRGYKWECVQGAKEYNGPQFDIIAKHRSSPLL